MKNFNIFLLLIGVIFSLGILGYILIKMILPKSYTVTSWWRSPYKNKEVGGVSNSMHLIGLAYDVSPIPKEKEIKKLFFFTKKIKYTNHIHLQWI